MPVVTAAHYRISSRGRPRTKLGIGDLEVTLGHGRRNMTAEETGKGEGLVSQGGTVRGDPLDPSCGRHRDVPEFQVIFSTPTLSGLPGVTQLRSRGDNRLKAGDGPLIMCHSVYGVT